MPRKVKEKTQVIAVDWSNKDENLAVFDGKVMSEALPAPSPNLVIYTENLPVKYARPFFDQGTRIFCCKTTAVAAIRKKEGIAKSHEADARIIYRMCVEAPETHFTEWKFDSFFAEFRDYWACFKQVQGDRNMTGNRMYAGTHAIVQEYHKSQKQHEAMFLTEMKRVMATMPIFTEFLDKIKGVGPAISAGILAHVGDIEKFPTLAKFNAYFGLHVKDGKAPRRTAGQTANWSNSGKSIFLGNLASALVQHGEPIYKDVYVEEKERQLIICEKMFAGLKTSGGKDVPWKLIAERRARRKMVKKFVRHFYYAYKRLGAGTKVILKDDKGFVAKPPRKKRAKKLELVAA